METEVEKDEASAEAKQRRWTKGTGDTSLRLMTESIGTRQLAEVEAKVGGSLSPKTEGYERRRAEVRKLRRGSA